MRSSTGFKAEPATSLRARLQQSTQSQHRNVERHLRLDRPVWTAPAYRAVLEKMWGLYLPLESQLDRIDWQDSGIVMHERRKTPWLRADLAYFGLSDASIAALDLCGDVPRIDSIAAGLGALYVLEGATLGGQVILGRLQPGLGISPGNGGTFYASYGKMIGIMWRSYLAAMERVGIAPSLANAIERGAVETFAAFERWLSVPALAVIEGPPENHV